MNPSQVFPNMATLAANDPAPVAGIFIPFSDIPALDPAEADLVNGDGREVVRALYEKSFEQYDGMNPDDRPANMTLRKTTSPISNVLNGIQQTYTAEFRGTFDPDRLTLQPEPAQ